jgi:hypothetical protein
MVDGIPVVNLHRVIGLSRSIVVMTVSIHDDQLSFPQARMLMEKHLEAMIRSLRPAGKKP